MAEEKIGKNGVMAKVAATNAQARENAAAVKKIDASVNALQGDIKAQARENDAAAAKMNTGTREIIAETGKVMESFKAKAKEFDAYADDFYYG